MPGQFDRGPLDWALPSEIVAYVATTAHPLVTSASEFTACFTVQFTTDRRAQHILGRAIERAPGRNRSSVRDERRPWQLRSI